VCVRLLSSRPLSNLGGGGQQAAIEALVAAGAELGAADVLGGDTALHLAALWGHTAAVRLLLRRGADVAALDGLGNTPLHHAADSGHAPVSPAGVS
jgi:ankyrin repeat protein